MEKYNETDLEVYLGFINMGWAYNNYNGPVQYDVFLKKFNQGYKRYYDGRIGKYNKQLIELSTNCNVCITPIPDSYPKYCELIDLIDGLMREFSSKDENLAVMSTDKDNIKVKTLVLDDDNYIQIRVDCFEQHSMSYQSTSDKMSNIVKIFEHVFKMLDKNFRREK